jgi:hypothetical protein
LMRVIFEELVLMVFLGYCFSLVTDSLFEKYVR